MGVRSTRRVYRDQLGRKWLNNFETRELTRKNRQSIRTDQDINPTDGAFTAFDYLFKA
jgi:hypothetical protein